MIAQSMTVHASAVLVGARAVLIRGPSGAGKSRLAFELHRGDARRWFAVREARRRRPRLSRSCWWTSHRPPRRDACRSHRGPWRRAVAASVRAQCCGRFGCRPCCGRRRAAAGGQDQDNGNRGYIVAATRRRSEWRGLAGGSRTAHFSGQPALLSGPLWLWPVGKSRLGTARTDPDRAFRGLISCRLGV